MISIFDGIIDFIKTQLVDGTVQMLERQNTQIGFLSNALSQNASEYSPTAFDSVMAIAENVMLPIAGVILTYVAVTELIDMVVNNNNMHESTTADIMKWIFKTSIAILLVSNAFTIVSAIIEVGGQLVLQAIPYAENIVAQEGKITLQANLMELTLTENFMIWGTVLFNTFLYYLLRFVINLFIVGRILEIYMYLSVAPVPMATAGSRQLSDTSLSYTRNVIALALQGVIILIAIAIYNALTVTFAVNRTLSGDFGAILAGLFESLTLIGALALVVIKSKSIANSIVGTR